MKQPTKDYRSKYAYQKWSFFDLIKYIFWKCPTEMGVAWMMLIIGLIAGLLL
jgi:hypothetical protein